MGSVPPHTGGGGQGAGSVHLAALLGDQSERRAQGYCHRESTRPPSAQGAFHSPFQAQLPPKPVQFPPPGTRPWLPLAYIRGDYVLFPVQAHGDIL